MTTENKNILFEPLQLGEFELPNRIVMAPMTRGRANHQTHVPTEIMESYYEQRASAGLIISEGIIISEIANGYINIPGIFNSDQVAAWRKITDRVHQKRGRIFAQIWHVGYISHPDLIGGNLPLAPSAINPNFYAYTLEGQKDTVTPKEMTIQEIKETIADFKQAAINAIEAGFDGIELHGANAYLIHQFIATSSNQRKDAYGGSVENRARFLLEILDEVTLAIGNGKTGLRLNPVANGVAGIVLDEETKATFDYIIARLNSYNLAYLHLTGVMDAPADGHTAYEKISSIVSEYRNVYHGIIIINNGFTKKAAESVIQTGTADLVAFGLPFIANPDLVERFQDDLELANPDIDTLYQGSEKGYIDYTIIK